MAAPNGLFAQALTARSRSVLLWSLPLWGVFLLALTPWRGEDGGWAPAFALWAANARDGAMPVTGWIAAGLWALAGLLAAWISWRGLVGLLRPERSGPWRDLARSGDAAGAIAAFEREAAAPLLRLDRPLVVVTPSWLLLRSGAVMQLVPLDDVAWVHGAKDTSGVFVGGALQLAGVIDAATRREVAAQPDADLVLYRRSTGEREALPADAALPALLDHFIACHPAIVVGFAPQLKAAWETDRAGFETVARTAAALSMMEPDTAARDVEALFAAKGLAEAAVGLAQTSVAAIDPQADFETVIAPVKAAKGLGDQLAARADRGDTHAASPPPTPSP